MYLSVSEVAHAVSNLGTDVEQVSGVEVDGRWLIAEAGGDCVATTVTTRCSQETEQITVTHVFHDHVHRLCGGAG